MKLTEFITDIGRPVAFYPGLRKVTGSTTATLFICQLIYWTGKQKDKDGWIYKTSDEVEEETGLSYKEQVTARKKLVDLGFIQERYRRIEHRMEFRVMSNALNESWASYQLAFGENTNSNIGNDQLGDSLTESTTEITQENTTEEVEEPTFFSKIFENKNQWIPDNPKQALDHPIISFFINSCGWSPAKKEYQNIIDTMVLTSKRYEDKQSMADDLKKYKLAWVSRIGKNGQNYSPSRLVWFYEWFVNDTIPAQSKPIRGYADVGKMKFDN